MSKFSKLFQYFYMTFRYFSDHDTLFEILRCGHHAMYVDHAYTEEILDLPVPDRGITVKDALNFICKHYYDEDQHAVAGIQRALGGIGLHLARTVPGYVLGMQEARLYVRPRVMLAAFPHLDSSAPRPFVHSLTLDTDELTALRFPSIDPKSKVDWPENNCFNPTVASGFIFDEEVVREFEAAILSRVLPQSQTPIQLALDALRGGIEHGDKAWLERCDALHLELEDIGVRFHTIGRQVGPRGVSRDGFLWVCSSINLVRSYPELEDLCPPFSYMWPLGLELNNGANESKEAPGDRVYKYLGDEK
ncbi:hypothetical protein [Variovorax saccharolyticus]|uniref:hypothetical protein n=1 Tax=Variovorax saccharolyticus TaxID=3053516 RepID=UPI00257873E7|nr:hypothetical protein [Variovorax sp. J31P216]MDM0029848.1 hypothetical protein [Variovorax sp. J31P216]